MPNTILTPTVIANELLMRFKNNLGFAKTVSHEYDEKFDKIGDTYNLREPVRFIANDGADITSAIQDVNEAKIPLQINTQKNAAFKFGAKDLTLSIDRFAERYLESASVALANKFEADGLTMAYQSTYSLVGTPGASPATSQVILDAGVKLDNNSAPVDDNRYIVLNPKGQSTMVEGLKSLLNPGDAIGKQYRKGRMGQALGFDFAMAQNVRTHTVGPLGGSPAVNGASQTGATLLTKSWTAAAASRLKKGDTFTIAGVYGVNPVSGDVLPDLQQFVVTADFSSDASGNGSVAISPSIVVTGPTKTVNASPADSAAITVVGTASTGYPQNLAYHKHAFVYAMVPLEVPNGRHFAKTAVDPDSGLSIRMISDYNVLTDDFVTRCDILYGWAARRAAWSCRITG